MTVDELHDLVKDGKFFTVRFIKRTDGTERLMNCRIRPPVTDGPGMPYDPRSYQLLTVWETRSRAWRNIPVDNVLEIRAHGQRIA